MQTRSFLRRPLLGCLVLAAFLVSDLTRFRAQAACAECQTEHQFVAATKTKHAFPEFKSSGDTNEVKMFLKLTRTYTRNENASATGDVAEYTGGTCNLYNLTTNTFTSAEFETVTQTNLTTLTNPVPVVTYGGSASISYSSTTTGSWKTASGNCCSRQTTKTNETTVITENSTVIMQGGDPYWDITHQEQTISHFSIWWPGCSGSSISPYILTNAPNYHQTNYVGNFDLGWTPAGTNVINNYDHQKWVNGPVTWEQKLENEYTTAQLRSQAVTALPAYSGGWQPGSAAAYYQQSDFKRRADVGRMKYRFKVLGEKDEQYKVWYWKITTGPRGEFLGYSLESEPVTGAGPLTWAYTAEKTEEVPGTPQTVSVQYIGVTAADEESPTGGDGPPGSGGVTAGTGGAESGTGPSCTTCGSGGGSGGGGAGGGGGGGGGLSLRTRRGYAQGGGSVGYVGFDVVQPGWDVYTPARLRWTTGAQSDVRYSGGVLAQILDPQGLVFLEIVSTNKYRIRFYHRTQVATTNGALVTLTGGAQPHTVWTVENPNAGTTNFAAVRLTSTNSAGTIRQFDAAFTTNPVAGNQSGWKVESPGDLFEQIVTAGTEVGLVNGVTTPLRTERTAWRPVGSTNESRVRLRKLAVFPWGEGLIEEVIGAGSAARTNTYTYLTNAVAARGGAPLETVTRADGTWEKREYDGYGRLTDLYTGHETGGPDLSGSYRRVNYDYSPVVTGDTGTYGPDQVRTETEYINWGAVRRTIHGYLSNEHREIRCLSGDGAWNDAGNLVTRTFYFTAGGNSGKTDRVIHPDGTVTLYGYAGPTNAVVETVATGQPDGAATSATRVLNGTLTTTTYGAYGELASRVQRALAAGATNQVIASETHSLPDEFNRPLRVTYLDGTYTERSFGCCGLTTTSDREGVLTEYFYDAALRPTATRRLGLTFTNVLDLDGRVLERRRIGTDVTTNILWQGLYNLAGELYRETNTFGGVTTYAETTDEYERRVRTTTQPDTGTRIETFHRDGSLFRLTGTAVLGREYHVAAANADRDGQATEYLWGEARQETVLDANGDATGETTYTYTDSRGFTFRRDDALSHSRYWYYNTAGQLAWEKDEDGVVSLHLYDALGDREFSGLDVNSSESLTTASTDRLAYTKSYYTNVSSADWRYTVVREYPTDGSSTSLVTRERWEKTDGLEARDVAFGLTNRTTTAINRGIYTRTVNRYAPDGSYATDVFVSGRLSTSTRYNSASSQIGKTTLGYDPHGRRATAADARNGTTTFGYAFGDALVSVTTPQPGNGDAAQTTATAFNTSGRAWRVTHPDGTTVTNEFFATGQLKKTYGSRTYPVEYTYDPAGRMATMKTWRNFTAGTGAAVTGWTYDTAGRLTTKTYADASTVGYTYTDAGRLKTRTWARYTTTTYAYDFEDGGLGRKAGDLKVVSYDDGTTPEVRYAYDRRGRRTGVEQWTDFGATQVTATALTLHDSGLPTLESHTVGPQANMSLVLGYDQYLRRTNLVAKQNGSTYVLTNRYGYDTASRLNLIGNGTSDVSYAYLANSSLAGTVTHSQGGSARLTTTRTVDRLNRLLNTAAVPSGSAQPTLGSAYVYNAANQRTHQTLLADGSTWVYEYDSLGQVKSGKRYWADGTLVAGQQFEYGFDDIGNRSSAKTGGDALGANLRSQGYTVNDLNLYTTRTNPRYLEVQGAAQTTATVQVDGSTSGVLRQGEYFRRELGSLAGTGPAWQTVAVSLSGGTNTGTKRLFLPPATESYTHDADGNLTQDGQWDYGWDAENRLVAMSSVLTGSPAAPLNPTLARKLTWQYDALGRVLERTEYAWSVVDAWWAATPTAVTRYLYDGWDCVAEFSVSGATVTHQRSYVWGLDLSGSRTGAGGVGGLVTIYQAPMSSPTAHFTAYDGNGNVVALVKASDGTLSARYEYGPFGEALRATGDAIAAVNPWRFSTKRTDPTTALVHYEYRVYQPITGRWLSRDPMEEMAFANIMAFAANNPLSIHDYLGLCNVGDLLKGVIGDALKQRIQELIRKQILKTAAKAGVAAVVDGPLPIGDIIAAGMSIYDGIGLAIDVGNMQGMTKDAMRQLCQSLAEDLNCLNDPKCCQRITQLLKNKAGTLGGSLSRRRKNDFFEGVADLQREIRKALKDCCPCPKKTQGHHSDQKYLGGDPSQPLTEMVPGRHGAGFGSGGFHGAFDAQNPDYARRVGSDNIRNRDGAGFGNNTLQVQLDAYDKNYPNFADAACDFLLNSKSVSAAFR